MNSRSLREISFVQKLTLNWGYGNVHIFFNFSTNNQLILSLFAGI
jgi:hypothetical protein